MSLPSTEWSLLDGDDSSTQYPKNSTSYFWLVTAKDSDAYLKATLTLIGGSLAFIACLGTTIMYFMMHKNPAVFNSMNHFFAFAFALGAISSVNYMASAIVRLASDDIALLTGFCDVSAFHVLISTYPMLLCEMGYFVAAYLRLRGAYALGKKEVEKRQRDAERQQNPGDSSLTSTNAGMIETAINIVDSGETFFRRFCGIGLVVCFIGALVLQAALPKQHVWHTKFDPSDQVWCWVPTDNGDGSKDNNNAREGTFIVLQLFVEIVPLLGTPTVGIVTLVFLYRSLGGLPRSAKARVIYIVVFLFTFLDAIFVRMQFAAAGASRFQAFAEPFIPFANACTFIFSEIYPVYLAARPRRLGGEQDRLIAEEHARDEDNEDRLPNYMSHENFGNTNGGVRHDQNVNTANSSSAAFQEPTLVVAIEAGAYLQCAMIEQQAAATANSARTTMIPEERVGDDAAGARAEIQRRRSQRISQKLYHHAAKQRADSTMFILMVNSFLNGFVDVWGFVSFGTFTNGGVVANVGVVSLAVAYSAWMPHQLADRVEVAHHIVLTVLSVVIPVVVAAVVTRLVVRENHIIDRRHSMSILGAAVVVLFLTWIGSLSFFSVVWFDSTERNPFARYLAICGLSIYSGLQLAYHRIFLALFKLPSEPFITSTLLDLVSSSWLTPSATIVLTAASAERFPTYLRKQVQTASTISFIVGCLIALIAGVYEAGGAFGISPILGVFVLLLSLDWNALEDQVLIPAREVLIGMGGGDVDSRRSTTKTSGSTKNRKKRRRNRKNNNNALYTAELEDDLNDGSDDGDGDDGEYYEEEEEDRESSAYEKYYSSQAMFSREIEGLVRMDKNANEADIVTNSSTTGSGVKWRNSYQSTSVPNNNNNNNGAAQHNNEHLVNESSGTAMVVSASTFASHGAPSAMSTGMTPRK